MMKKPWIVVGLVAVVLSTASMNQSAYALGAPYIPQIAIPQIKESSRMNISNWGITFPILLGYTSEDNSTKDSLSFTYRKENAVVGIDATKGDILQGSNALELYKKFQEGMHSQIQKNGYNHEQMKVLTIHHMPWLYISYEIPTGETTEPVIKEEYTLIGYGKMYVFSFFAPKSIYKSEKGTFEKFIQSVDIKDTWRAVTVANTNYSFEVPDSFIGMTAEQVQQISSEHTYLSGDPRFMTGVIVQPLEKYSFLPKSLANLTATDKERLEKGLVAKAQGESQTVKKGSFTYTTVNGKPCIIWDTTDQGSHNRSYIFVQDGNYISFDYGYEESVANTVLPLVEQSAKSIQL